MSETSSPASSEEVDVETERRRTQAQQYQTVLATVDPRVKTHPALHSGVLSRLEILKTGRSKTWGDSNLARDFYAWSRAASVGDKPSLDFALAVISTHDGISNFHRNDIFNKECDKRGLRAWVEEQLELLETPKPADEAPKKRKKAVKLEEHDTESELALALGRPDAVLPSIEGESSTSSHALPSLKPKSHQHASPSTELSSEGMTSPAAEAPAKRRKTSHQVLVPKLANLMRNATTQTDMSLLPGRAPEAASTLTESITSAFQNAITQQTEALSKAFNSNMQMMLQGDMVEDGQMRNVQHLRSLPPVRHAPVELAPSQPALLLFDQQSTTNMHGNASYEIERPIGRRVVARQVVEEPPQAFSVEAFRYVPRTFKREYQF